MMVGMTLSLERQIELLKEQLEYQRKETARLERLYLMEPVFAYEFRLALTALAEKLLVLGGDGTCSTFATYVHVGPRDGAYIPGEKVDPAHSRALVVRVIKTQRPNTMGSSEYSLVVEPHPHRPKVR